MSDMEFRNQIIILAIKLEKNVNAMILIALFNKFQSYKLITSVKVCNMARCFMSSKSDELRNIKSIGW